MAFQTIELNMIPHGDKPVFYASQYETGRPIIIDILMGDDAFNCDDLYIELHCRKVDDNIVTLLPDSVDGNQVTFIGTEQLFACSGNNLCEVCLYVDDSKDTSLGSLNFFIEVEPDPLYGGITSESEIANLTGQITDIVESVMSDDYYTKAETDDLLADKADVSDLPDMTDYYNKTQTDTLLSDKANTSDLATVAITGDYNDLTNKPTIPAAQIQSDWTQADNTKVDYIKNKPDLDDYLTVSQYNDDMDGLNDALDHAFNAVDAFIIKSTGTENEAPYLFRAKPNSVGNRCLDKLVGGTVAFNQLVQNGNFASDSNWSLYNSNYAQKSISNNVLTLTIIQTAGVSIYQYGVQQTSVIGDFNHKYLFIGTVKGSRACKFTIELGGQRRATFDLIANTKTDISFVSTSATYNRTLLIYPASADVVSVNDTFELSNIMVIDLTAMFGSTIADYIYSLEQGTAGAGVAWFRNLFPKSYYAYNAGTLMSVKTSKHITVGFNAYDNSTGKANVVGGNQYQITGTYTSLTLNGETITPNASGIFTPDTSGEITVVGGNATNTCIHLVWDGERNGEYEPYVKHEYDLSGSRLVHRVFGYRDYESGDESLADAITDGTHTVYKLAEPFDETVSNPELRGILKLDSNNKLYYYGDTCEDFTNPQIVDDFGTEEYVDTREVPIPVGHDTIYAKKTDYRYW